MNRRIRLELYALNPLDEIECDHLTDALSWVDSAAQLFEPRSRPPSDHHLRSL